MFWKTVIAVILAVAAAWLTKSAVATISGRRPSPWPSWVT